MARPRGLFDARKTALLRQVKVDPAASDKSLAKALNLSTRYVQRIIGALKEERAIDVRRTRFKHPQMGWCNARSINVLEKD
jgi:transcription initiation factor IIE alpha subunit